MTGIWSSIKAAAPALAQSQQPHEISTARPPSPPTTPGAAPTSRSPPRPSTSLDARTRTRSQDSTTPQSHSRSPGIKRASRLSRNSTSITIKATSQAKDRDTETEDAGEFGDTTAAILGTGNGSGSSADVVKPAPSTPAYTPGASSAIDPLSQQIFMRKNTEPSIPQRLTQMAEGLARASSDLSRNVVTTSEAAKEKSNKKGGSFLSRLSMRGNRKKDSGDLDSDSELGSEARMDGSTAHVFSETRGTPLIGGGYVPHHKEPPRYIRTRATNKRTREFNRMFLAQELVGTRPPEANGDSMVEAGKAPTVSVSVAGASDRKTMRTGGAIWATEFSKDGRYLATAGRDRVVRIWAVLSTPDDRRAHEDDEAVHGDAGERLSAPVFRDQPVMEFHGHTGEVLDLSWSKNNFLLSSSMDKTVRLWHMSRSECLCTFKHQDFVTRLAFHPRDDRFFLAGSLDTMLRLWSIPDKAVAFSAQLPDLVTAVAFSPDGEIAIAGLLNGLCMFYETEGLKLSSQIHVRSSRGKNARGSKITGIQTMAIPPPNPINTASLQPPGSASTSVRSTDVTNPKEARVLITSNDSRIRIYNLRDKSLDVKLKGHENQCSQIAATLSDDGKYVICGSEDRKTFIWSLTGTEVLVQDKDKSPCEYFEAHGDIVTTALFAPTKTRMLLGQSGDPIYDLCNPPPVVLQSLEEAASAATSQVALTNDSHQAPVEPASKRPEPSPAYIARSTHYDGNIIVTTGDTGIIKVFRQDCAFAKRKHDNWETSSTFSRKLTAHGGSYVGGGLARSGSVLTRTSAGSTAHSRRGSLSQSIASSTIGSHQLNALGVHSDRILSWRLGIEHGGDRRSALLANGGGTPARSERSLSPTKASRTSLNSAYNLAGEARKQPYGGASPARNRADSTVTSPTASVLGAPSERLLPTRLVKDNNDRPNKERRNSKKQEEPPSVPPTPGFTLCSAAEETMNSPSTSDSAGGSSSFWNLGRWRGITGFRASSSNQGTAANPRTRISGGRPSLSKSRNQTEISCDEREVDDKDRGQGETGSRRQSAGMVSVKGAGDDAQADRRMSIPNAASLQREGESNVPTVSTDGGREKEGP
ncbi:WD40 repeat-like protein [Parathielavia appendiculata]|uniref:WD40 repeat-like protein n=1 Tax=Parathielavia appendiculata TaxID=2587402 RepID=A0AAN6Z0N5_9PEZI|nr:WD40 repeat-like protein [Parathielavia appendiculata]